MSHEELVFELKRRDQLASETLNKEPDKHPNPPASHTPVKQVLENDENFKGSMNLSQQKALDEDIKRDEAAPLQPSVSKPVPNPPAVHSSPTPNVPVKPLP